MSDAMGEALLKAKKQHAMLSVVVPAKRHARTTPLKYALLDKQMTDLAKGKRIPIEGVRVRLISPTSQEGHSTPQVLLIVSARGEHIHRINRFQNVLSQIVMPHLEDDERKWREVYG